MSNKSTTLKHGLSTISIIRAKSKLRVRKNKAKARQRRAERRAIINLE